MDPVIILFGLGVGILVGATGMGGGSIMTPLLIIVMGVNPVVAIGTDLAYAAVTKTVGGIRHIKARSVDFRIVIWLAFGSIPGALAGVWALHRLENVLGASFDKVILLTVAAALLLTSGAVMFFALTSKQRQERETVDLTSGGKAGTVLFGLVIGIVLGVTSAGSGSLIAVGLIVAYRLTPLRVVGTDVAHAALLLWFAAAAHAIAGNVNYGMAGTILIGSVPGVWFGASIATRLPAGALRPLLGLVLLAAGLGLITKAGLKLPPEVILGVPLAVAIVFGSYMAGRARGLKERTLSPVLASEPKRTAA
ncbi:MAG: sulfite exporter TauE/SafE family protein [Solirubrobacterales bacterium]|nr:sulfite exporter TauE/SafE family protein [Solirubrobacterales bacterium]